MQLQHGIVAANARSIAARRNMTHVALAEALGLTKVSMSRRMRGDVSFSAEEAFTLAATLRVPIEALYEIREGDEDLDDERGEAAS